MGFALQQVGGTEVCVMMGDFQMVIPSFWNQRLGSAPGLASSSLSGGIVAVDQCRDVVAQYVIIC